MSTPGPWKLRPSGEANHHTLDNSDVNWLVTIHQNGELSTVTQEANATLIAASPTMLEALEDIERTLADHSDVAIGNSKVHYCYHKARSARITAKGE